jgi:hypothetical protein
MTRNKYESYSKNLVKGNEMLDKSKVQESLNRVDNAVAQLNLRRQDHIILTQDMRLLNECCMEYFEDESELKETRVVRMPDHGGTDKQPVDAEFSDPN